VTQDKSRFQFWGALRCGPSSEEKHDMGEIQLAGKVARARQMHMQKRKSCAARMQEDLDMIGLGFW
jgi:hypothetical protein